MKLFIAIATLVGMIVGAGVLGIPYVISQAGVVSGIINLLVLGAVLVVLNLYMGEITLRTNGNHQLSGYAHKYLGEKGKYFLLAAVGLQVYGALTAYLIGEGTTLSSLFGGNPTVFSIVFFIIASIFIHHGLRTVGKTELYLTSGLVLIVIFVTILAAFHIDPTNYVGGSGSLLAPYGVILFAYYGVVVIPLLKEELTEERKQLKKAILWGSIIPIIIYTTFGLVAMGVIGLNGFNALPVDERIASAAIHGTINGLPGILLDIFAVLAMGTSFLASGVVMKKVYVEDLNLHKVAAVLLTLSIPFLIFLLDVFADITNFISIIGLVGGVLGSITGMLIVLMYHKARVHSERMPEYSLHKHVWLSYVLVAVFVGGLVYQIVSFF